MMSTFFERWYNAKFKNVLDMMYGKIPIEIPEKNDQIYALCSTLIYQVWRGENESEEQKRITGFYNIIKELPPEFMMMCINGALYGRSKELSASAAKKMLAHPLYKTVMEQYRKHMN